MNEITFLVAFFAGLISFLSPCVLPIIPGFLAYLAGTSLKESKNHRKEIFLNSLFFVAGFSIVFSVLGILLTTVFQSISFSLQLWLSRIGGIIVIFFGLYLTGLISFSFFEREHKLRVKRKFKSKYLSSFVFGFAFAVGWTPCVGPVLAGILGLTATQPAIAFYLLLAYTFGLGIPFLLVGLFPMKSSEFIQRNMERFKYLKIIFGILLIILGILVFTQKLILISNFEFVTRLLSF